VTSTARARSKRQLRRVKIDVGLLLAIGSFTFTIGIAWIVILLSISAFSVFPIGSGQRLESVATDSSRCPVLQAIGLS